MAVSNTQVPERAITNVLELGLAAVRAAAAGPLLDSILRGCGPAEIAKAKVFFAKYEAVVRVGYPSDETPFPCVFLMLQGETPIQEYLSQGEEALWPADDDGVQHRGAGFEFKCRTRAEWGLHVMTQNPDSCLWTYRVVRRIMNVAIRRLGADDLQTQVLTGQDLVPDPQYGMAGVFVRRLMLSTESEERWNDQDGIWAAINGPPPDHLTGDGTLDIFHEDAGGGVVPYTPGDSEG